MLVRAGFKPALSQILRDGPMTPRISREPRLPEEGGFETRPYKRHDVRALHMRRPHNELGGLQYPAASAPRVRLSAAPTSPSGVTIIELAELHGRLGTRCCPRAASARRTLGSNPGSTTTSSGSH